MANKDYAAISSQPAGSHTKMRVEQIRSEDGFASLAIDLEALRGQVKDIIGAADYKENITGDLDKVQLVDLAHHLNAASGSAELVVKLASAMSGAVQMYSTLNVDGEATLASAIVEDLSASRLMASDAGKGLVSIDLDDWVAGTANQVTVTDDSDGSITLSLPQDIHSGATPEFAGVKVTGLTEGRVVFVGAADALVDDGDMTYNSGSNVLTIGGSTFGQDVSIAGNLTVLGTTTSIDTTNLLVEDAKVVISSGSIVEGAGIYLGSDANVDESIRWTLADDGKWIASDKFMADTLQAGDLSSALVWADASGNLVEVSAQDFADAIEARLVAGVGVSIVEAGGFITASIGQPVATTDSVTFAVVTGSNLTASRLMASNGSKAMVSADLFAWVAGTANQVSVADDSDGSITLSLPQDIHSGASPEFAKLKLDGSDIYLDTASGDLVLHATGSGNSIKFEYGADLSIELGSVGLVGFTATDIMGALNELKSTASASSKKATYEVGAGGVAAATDVKASLSSNFISELDAANGMVFVNGQLMLSGALGSKDYTTDGNVLKFTFGLSDGDVVVVQKA